MGGDCCGWNWKCVYDSTNFHSITGKVGFSCVIYLYRWMIWRKGRGGNSRIWWSFNNYSTRTCWFGIGMGGNNKYYLSIFIVLADGEFIRKPHNMLNLDRKLICRRRRKRSTHNTSYIRTETIRTTDTIGEMCDIVGECSINILLSLVYPTETMTFRFIVATGYSV